MIDKKNFKLSVIIPCYNEKKTIQAILEKVIESLNNYKIVDYEIIIVDDSSDDGTKELLNHFYEININYSCTRLISIKNHFHQATSG